MTKPAAREIDQRSGITCAACRRHGATIGELSAGCREPGPCPAKRHAIHATAHAMARPAKVVKLFDDPPDISFDDIRRFLDPLIADDPRVKPEDEYGLDGPPVLLPPVMSKG